MIFVHTKGAWVNCETPGIKRRCVLSEQTYLLISSASNSSPVFCPLIRFSFHILNPVFSLTKIFSLSVLRLWAAARRHLYYTLVSCCRVKLHCQRGFLPAETRVWEHKRKTEKKHYFFLCIYIFFKSQICLISACHPTKTNTHKKNKWILTLLSCS